MNILFQLELINLIIYFKNYLINQLIDLELLLKTLIDLENGVKEYKIIKNIYKLIYSIIFNIFTYPNEEKYKNINIKNIRNFSIL